MVEKAGQNAPALYFKGERAFEELVKRDDVDLVYIATPWEWHASPALAGMNAGKHTNTGIAYVVPAWRVLGRPEHRSPGGRA